MATEHAAPSARATALVIDYGAAAERAIRHCTMETVTTRNRARRDLLTYLAELEATAALLRSQLNRCCLQRDGAWLALKEARSALDWYADPDNYRYGTTPPVLSDGGERARRARGGGEDDDGR